MPRPDRALALLLCAAVLCAAVLAAACDDGVDLIGECTLGEARRVADAPLVPSVGMLDGRVLVSVAWDLPTESLTVRRSAHEARWLDAALAPEGEPISLGSGLVAAAWRPRWLAHDGALVGHLWTRPEPPPPWSEDTVSLWTVTPPPAASARATAIGFQVPPPEEDPAVWAVGMGGLRQPGAELVFPLASAEAHVVGVAAAMPAACGRRYGNYLRLHALHPEWRDARPVLWGDAACAGELHDRSREVGSPWAFSTEPGAVSVLFRDGDGVLQLVRLDSDLGVRDGPRRVGAHQTITTTDDGFQPRAVSVPGGRVLFLERLGYGNYCHLLRIMDDDGECAEDAPWQLPCMRDGIYETDRDLETSYVELLAVPGGAVVVWGQHTNPHRLRITATTPYREGIYAALLTPEGRRGSPIVRVTDEGFTALAPVPRTETDGPFPVRPVPSAAAEGAELAVAWPDRREHAPGVYVRRLTCAVGGR